MSWFQRGKQLAHIFQELRTMSASLDALTAEVALNTTVTQSAVALLSGLSAQLTAAIAASKAGDSGAALDALDAQLKTNTDALAAAVTANTPVTP